MDQVNYIALILENIDKLGTDFTAATYGVLATSLSPLIYSFFIIYLIFWGFQYWQGYGETYVSRFIFRLFRISIIFSMATSWGSIQTFSYDIIRKSPSNITAVLLSNIINSGKGGMSTGTIERDMFDIYRFGYRGLEYSQREEGGGKMDSAKSLPSTSEASSDYSSQAGEARQDTPPGLALSAKNSPLAGKQIFNVFIFVITSIFIGSVVAVIIFSKVTLWLCLSLAPFFISLLMFNFMKPYFDLWLNIIIKSIIIPVFVYVFLGFYFISVKNIVVDYAVMLQKPEKYTFDNATGFVLVSVCGFFLIAKIIPVISQIATNTQSVTLNAASSKLLSFVRANDNGPALGGGGKASGKSTAFNTSGGSLVAGHGDHSGLEAQELQAAARRQSRNR